jgi:GcrA cell cycle regulator
LGGPGRKVARFYCDQHCQRSKAIQVHREKAELLGRLLLATTASFGESKPMESTNWTPEHSAALREYHAKGMSYSEIADAINAKFKTSYSRCAAIGRAKRLGLAGPDRPGGRPKSLARAKARRRRKLRKRQASASLRLVPMPVFAAAAPVKLRCVEIVPRHLALVDLLSGDCRYPYGGDEEGEAITFCGHPKRENSSYCTAHFHLTRGPGTASERAAGTVTLRIVGGGMKRGPKLTRRSWLSG